MSNPYRILITGSRAWDNGQFIWQAIASTAIEFVPPTKPIVIVHGACPHGADSHASAWANLVRASGRRPVTEERHPADWEQHGKAAGFRRNAEMVNLGADICLAFIRNGSRGASHTAALAEQAGIPVRRWTA
jgi:SLOG family YspA-like protein